MKVMLNKSLIQLWMRKILTRITQSRLSKIFMITIRETTTPITQSRLPKILMTTIQDV